MTSTLQPEFRHTESRAGKRHNRFRLCRWRNLPITLRFFGRHNLTIRAVEHLRAGVAKFVRHARCITDYRQPVARKTVTAPIDGPPLARLIRIRIERANENATAGQISARRIPVIQNDAEGVRHRALASRNCDRKLDHAFTSRAPFEATNTGERALIPVDRYRLDRYAGQANVRFLIQVAEFTFQGLAVTQLRVLDVKDRELRIPAAPGRSDCARAIDLRAWSREWRSCRCSGWRDVSDLKREVLVRSGSPRPYVGARCYA